MIFGCICIVYYLMICIYLGRLDSRFPRIWLLFAAVSFGLELIPEESGNNLYTAGRILGICFLFLFLWVETLVVLAMLKRSGDYVIVLGAKVDGYHLTDALRQRLDRALEYLNAHPGARAVVSGGQGSGENITEAGAMADYLEACGIARSRILREEASTTTRENLILSGKLILKEQGGNLEEIRAAIVTNNFHMYRAVMIAKQVGYRNIQALNAPTAPVMLVNYMVREFFGVLKMWAERNKNGSRMDVNNF